MYTCVYIHIYMYMYIYIYVYTYAPEATGAAPPDCFSDSSAAIASANEKYNIT